MPTVAVVHFPSGGHIRPILPLVAALNENGLRTVQWAQSEWQQQCLAAGGEFRALPDLADLAWPEPQPFHIAQFLAGLAERLAPWMCEQLAEARCDVVLRDSFAQYGHYAALANGLDEYVIPAMMAFHRGVRPSARDAPSFALSLLRGAPQARNVRRISRRLQERYGQGLGSPLEVFAGRHGATTFALTVRSLQLRPKGLRGEDVRFIGPLRALGPGEGSGNGGDDDPALAGLGGERGVIYVSLGTVFEQRPEFFRMAAEALSRLGRRVILSIGRLPPESVQPLPHGVLAFSHVDQLAVLRRAGLFVSHGGFNSMQEGLAAGVPMVLCPQMFEQAINADMIVARGAGVRVRGDTAGALRAAAERVLRDVSYREAARRIAQELREGNRMGEAVGLLSESAQRHAAASI